MVHIQTFGYIPSLLFYLGRYFFSTLGFYKPSLFFLISVIQTTEGRKDLVDIKHGCYRDSSLRSE